MSDKNTINIRNPIKTCDKGSRKNVIYSIKTHYFIMGIVYL